MNFDSLCAARLKTERARLKLSQIQVSGLCGVSREMWGKYERGAAVRAAPLQVRMAALAALTSVQTEGVRVSGRNNRVAGHDYHEGKK